MGKFDRNSHSNSRGGGAKFGRRDGGRTEMFPATCAECGKPCQVPFEPRSGRPVYCNDCFGNHDDRAPQRFDRNHDNRDSRGHDDDRRMFSATCDECGKPCEVPFRPTAGKPVFCKECFSTKGGRKGNDKEGPSKPQTDQFAALHAKLDKIISALAIGKGKESVTVVPPVKEPVPAVKAVIKAKAKVTKKKAK